MSKTLEIKGDAPVINTFVWDEDGDDMLTIRDCDGDVVILLNKTQAKSLSNFLQKVLK